ncbi:oxygen-regulated 1-like protein [Labeo rohita]|uniref:Oxygen-regulated 1-like protein n=1 Tax=Labeo rohita TaxID=84645 RepID=A0A498MY98_LABRO|nr:oxygen-regulated 1-like protein [Labeo rohita]
MVINSRTFKTFDALLDTLSKKVPLPFGVRTITTPRGTHVVRTLDDVQDGGSYLCSDQKKVKPFNLDDVPKRQVPWNTTRPVSVGRQARRELVRQLAKRNEVTTRAGKMAENTVVVRTPKRLTVYKNRDPSMKRVIVLHRRTAPNFEGLLDYLSQVMQFPVVKLYTEDGRRVEGLPALILCSGIVVAAGNEPFRAGNYNLQAPTKVQSRISESVHPTQTETLLEHNRTKNESMETEGSQPVGSDEMETCDCKDGVEQRNYPIMPTEDDIEKSFRVNDDGSMTVEMKVHLTIKQEEMIHWTTTLSRTSVNNQQRAAVCNSMPQSGANSLDVTNDSGKESNGPHSLDSKEINTVVNKSVEFIKEEREHYGSDTSSEKPKSIYRRLPTPGPRQRRKEASVENIKMVSETEVQESTVGAYSYLERTAQGELTEGYCVVSRSSSSSTRTVSKPGKSESGEVKQKKSHSSFRSSGVAEILQLQNNGAMGITETVVHIYESQGTCDNYNANTQVYVDNKPGYHTKALPQKDNADERPASRPPVQIRCEGEPTEPQRPMGFCKSMPILRVPSEQDSLERMHKSSENLVPPDPFETSQSAEIKVRSGMNPVLQQLCLSVQSIKRALSQTSLTHLEKEKSSSLPDFSSQVASAFGSPSRALLSFLSLMTLRDTKDESQASSSNVCPEALQVMQSLEKISNIKDEEEVKASLTSLQSSTSSKLKQSWRDFQEQNVFEDSPPLSPRFSEQEFAVEVDLEGETDDQDKQHSFSIEHLLDELNMPEDLHREISSLVEGDVQYFNQADLIKHDNTTSEISGKEKENEDGSLGGSLEKAAEMEEENENIGQDDDKTNDDDPVEPESQELCLIQAHSPESETIEEDLGNEDSGIAVPIQSPEGNGSDTSKPEVLEISDNNQMNAENIQERVMYVDSEPESKDNEANRSPRSEQKITDVAAEEHSELSDHQDNMIEREDNVTPEIIKERDTDVEEEETVQNIRVASEHSDALEPNDTNAKRSCSASETECVPVSDREVDELNEDNQYNTIEDCVREEGDLSDSEETISDGGPEQENKSESECKSIHSEPPEISSPHRDTEGECREQTTSDGGHDQEIKSESQCKSIHSELTGTSSPRHDTEGECSVREEADLSDFEETISDGGPEQDNKSELECKSTHSEPPEISSPHRDTEGKCREQKTSDGGPGQESKSESECKSIHSELTEILSPHSDTEGECSVGEEADLSDFEETISDGGPEQENKSESEYKSIHSEPPEISSPQQDTEGECRDQASSDGEHEQENKLESKCKSIHSEPSETSSPHRDTEGECREQTTSDGPEQENKSESECKSIHSVPPEISSPHRDTDGECSVREEADLSDFEETLSDGGPEQENKSQSECKSIDSEPPEISSPHRDTEGECREQTSSDGGHEQDHKSKLECKSIHSEPSETSVADSDTECEYVEQTLDSSSQEDDQVMSPEVKDADQQEDAPEVSEGEDPHPHCISSCQYVSNDENVTPEAEYGKMQETENGLMEEHGVNEVDHKNSEVCERVDPDAEAGSCTISDPEVADEDVTETKPNTSDSEQCEVQTLEEGSLNKKDSSAEECDVEEEDYECLLDSHNNVNVVRHSCTDTKDSVDGESCGSMSMSEHQFEKVESLGMEHGYHYLLQPTEISQELLDIINSALLSSTLTVTSDSNGNLRIEPDKCKMREMFMACQRTDDQYGQKCLPSPSTSDLSDYRPETSDNGGYQSQELFTESGEEAEERLRIFREIIKQSSEKPKRINHVKENSSMKSSTWMTAKPTSSPSLKSSSLASFQDAKSAIQETVFHSRSPSDKSSLDGDSKSVQCMALKDNVDAREGVLIDKGRWLLKENHLIRNSPPVTMGMYGNGDTTSAGTAQDNRSEDSAYPYCENQASPLAVISSSELEDMAKPPTPKCTYFNMSHSSDSDPLLDARSVNNGNGGRDSRRNKELKVSPMGESSKVWAKENGSMSSFASVEFKLPDGKVHPQEGSGSEKI